MAETLKITLVKSTIGVPSKLRAVVKGLGLRRIDQSVARPNNEATRGMIAKVPHLVTWREVEE